MIKARFKKDGKEKVNFINRESKSRNENTAKLKEAEKQNKI